MSETTHAEDGEQAEDYCNLDETEHYAFELAIKEIIRETVGESDDHYHDTMSDLIEQINDGRTNSIFDKGVYRLANLKYDLCDRNDLIAEVAENPLIEIAELDRKTAILVHADYLDEFYAMMQERRSESEQ